MNKGKEAEAWKQSARMIRKEKRKKDILGQFKGRMTNIYCALQCT